MYSISNLNSFTHDQFPFKFKASHFTRRPSLKCFLGSYFSHASTAPNSLNGETSNSPKLFNKLMSKFHIWNHSEIWHKLCHKCCFLCSNSIKGWKKLIHNLINPGVSDISNHNNIRHTWINQVWPIIADRKQGAGWSSGSSAAVHKSNWVGLSFISIMSTQFSL